MYQICTGADPGFQVRGGALKKMAPSGGRGENSNSILKILQYKQQFPIKTWTLPIYDNIEDITHNYEIYCL
jgi:hypothetical protein